MPVISKFLGILCLETESTPRLAKAFPICDQHTPTPPWSTVQLSKASRAACCQDPGLGEVRLRLEKPGEAKGEGREGRGHRKPLFLRTSQGSDDHSRGYKLWVLSN